MRPGYKLNTIENSSGNKMLDDEKQYMEKSTNTVLKIVTNE